MPSRLALRRPLASMNSAISCSPQNVLKSPATITAEARRIPHRERQHVHRPFLFHIEQRYDPVSGEVTTLAKDLAEPSDVLVEVADDAVHLLVVESAAHRLTRVALPAIGTRAGCQGVGGAVSQ